mgnify:FL=1
MFLRQIKEGHLVEIENLQELISPLHATVTGRLHYGEEMQDPENFDKSALVFPSGEPLPKCWREPPMI